MTFAKFKIFVCLLGLILTSACINPNSSSSSSSSPGIFSREETLSPGKIEPAVNQMVARYRLSGQIKVSGVREIPKENSAVADLQFENFEYVTDLEGAHLIEAAKYKPPNRSQRNPTDPLPSMDEMFPPRKQVFNNQGTATLTKYNDGHWDLKEVRWGGYFVSGTIEIQ